MSAFPTRWPVKELVDLDADELRRYLEQPSVDEPDAIDEDGEDVEGTVSRAPVIRPITTYRDIATAEGTRAQSAQRVRSLWDSPSTAWSSLTAELGQRATAAAHSAH